MEKFGIKRIGIGGLMAMILCGSILSGAWAAMPETLIPGGETIGMELDLEGVSVVEPASDISGKAGLQPGDLICKVNGAEISSAQELRQAVRTSEGKLMELVVLRNGEEKTLRLSPLQTADGWKLGVYVRDRMKGIGTVTYYEEDGDFGALGHGVSGKESAGLLPIQGGNVAPSEVASVEKGQIGKPGCLHGAWEEGAICGKVERNTPQGIFGTMERGCSCALPVGDASEVHKGIAEIRSTVCGREVQTYTVEICEIHDTETHDRNLLIKVTDSELLNATGGIVQGMSGSPIIQDGKLIGAVTHV